MKDINQLITEKKSGPLKKLYMLTIMIPYQMWKEYKTYDDFFGKLDEDDLEDYEYLFKLLDNLDRTDTRAQFSRLSGSYDEINQLADYMLKRDLSKDEIGIWKEIKTYVE